MQNHLREVPLFSPNPVVLDPARSKRKERVLLDALLHLVGRLDHHGIGGDWDELVAARAAILKCKPVPGTQPK